MLVRNVRYCANCGHTERNHYHVRLTDEDDRFIWDDDERCAYRVWAGSGRPWPCDCPQFVPLGNHPE